VKRLALAAVLLLTALAQTGCTSMCTTVAREWGVAGCGETVKLNEPPRLGNYDQREPFPEVGQLVFFGVTAVDVQDDHLTFEWDFEGDGHIDDFASDPPDDGSHIWLSNVWYRYRAPAIAHLLVRVSDFPNLPGGPGEDTLTKRFRVHTREEYERDRPPVPAFTVSPDPVQKDVEARFDASASSDPDGDRLFYSWRALPSGGGSGRLTSPIFTPVLRDVGRSRWELTVTDDYGKEASTDRIVDVVDTPAPPHVTPPDINPAPPLVNEPVSISTDGSDPNGDIAYYEWDLDGQPGYELRTTEPALSTTFSAAGARTISVRATDLTGLTSSAGRGVQVVHAGGEGAPNAALAIDPNPARVGETVSFSAAGSTGPPTTPRYQWDLDGDGFYESDTTDPVTTRSYDTPGDHTIRVRVVHFVDGSPRVGVASQTLRVNAAPPNGEGPTARLRIDPNPALAGQRVAFDASASTDPTGDVATYEWDLDGSPGFEVEPDGTPFHERSYDSAGTFTVRVRVTDAAGHSDVASLAMRVESSVNAALGSAGRRPPARAFSATLTGSRNGRLRARIAGVPRLTSAERNFKRFLSARWRARPRLTFARRDRRARLSAVALASRRGDRACLHVKVDLRAGELPRGTFEVLGGTGQGARLRGTGLFRFQAARGKPALILGHLRARRGRPRGLPAACRRLAR
jgi:hypothetical protein